MERQIFESGGEPKRFTISEFQEDVRDRVRGRERDPWVYLAHLIFESRHREADNQLERHVGELAAASAEKPRWQKIIEHANSLADEAGMSREEFYSRALIELIEKLENARVTKELNEVYKNIDREEDVAFVNRLVRHYDPRLADE